MSNVYDVYVKKLGQHLNTTSFCHGFCRVLRCFKALNFVAAIGPNGCSDMFREQISSWPTHPTWWAFLQDLLEVNELRAALFLHLHRHIHRATDEPHGKPIAASSNVNKLQKFQHVKQKTPCMPIIFWLAPYAPWLHSHTLPQTNKANEHPHFHRLMIYLYSKWWFPY